MIEKISRLKMINSILSVPVSECTREPGALQTVHSSNRENDGHVFGDVIQYDDFELFEDALTDEIFNEENGADEALEEMKYYALDGMSDSDREWNDGFSDDICEAEPYVYSSYLKKTVSRSCKRGSISDYYSSLSYKPFIVEHDNKIIEIRTTAINVVNIYDLDSQSMVNIVSPDEERQSVHHFEPGDWTCLDTAYSDYSIGPKDVSKTVEEVTAAEGFLYCKIVPEENIASVLKNNKKRFLRVGIDIDKMKGSNTSIYIDGIRLKFNSKSLNSNIVDLLEAKDFQSLSEEDKSSVNRVSDKSRDIPFDEKFF